MGVGCQTPLQLVDPTQLQLVGIGADFVFSCHKKGRNFHLASSRRNDPTCLKGADQGFLLPNGYYCEYLVYKDDIGLFSWMLFLASGGVA